ncbi:hypothetical protein GP475_09695 [Corynebacterium poyangense]|uniref:Uncharacterized protein n=1 Tax=Corynebacterium poyangense TaxID=2684405 RepID=A0A7H0SQQ7_9CORY|nr:hypothetical protein [Corynebacterium poyangense]QNQ90882.1 hypothetical protein GP475_09695 [Corynebacterium poyangense]
MEVNVTWKDGKQETLNIINPDRVRFDLTRPRQGWPKFDEAPFIGLTFLAWSAAKRGGYEGTWEQFSEVDALDIEAVKEDGDDIIAP